MSSPAAILPAMSVPASSPIITKPTKTNTMTKKQKMQAAFASLYNDEEEEDLIDLLPPARSSGEIQQCLVTNVTMEDVDASALQVRSKGPSHPNLETSGDIDPGMETRPPIRTGWLGNSQFYVDPNIKLQKNGGLDEVIAYREAVARDCAYYPYDPIPLLTLSSTHGHLGFSDIAVGNSYRALLLIEAAMRICTTSPITSTHNLSTATPIYPQLDALAKTLVSTKYFGYGTHVMQDELRYLHLQAYQMLLSGLLGTASNWEGLVIVRAALKLYPDDLELKELQAELQAGFLDRSRGYKLLRLQEEMKKEEFVEATRMGKIYQKKYPWMDQGLYKRTLATLREANKGFEGSSCEIKAVVFGDAKSGVAKEGEDVGPLGVFATRDINEGEIVMIDRTVTGVSNIPPSKLEHCDTCQGCLIPPYMKPEKIVHTSCCNTVAFCSVECSKLASAGYHKVLCGQDFNWLYDKIQAARSSRDGSHWKPVSFLRVIAVILADMRKSKNKIHPLQHPLIARMSANYPPEDKIMGQFDVSHAWLYFTNVEAPTRILLQLGINVFTDPHWSQEVIQTIYWKIENNANMATTKLSGTEVRLININPNYLFLNHSCEPNLSWHGACPDGNVGIDWLLTPEGKVLQPGCSAVWCIAARDIKKGEELKISYVGNPKGDAYEGSGGGREGKRAWLSKWFDNGCGCAICEGENVAEKLNEKLNMSARVHSNLNCEMESIVEG